MSALDELLHEAEKLPEDQRMTLAQRLLAGGEPIETAEIEQVWNFEIRARIERYDRGQTDASPAGDVLAEVDRKLRR